MSKIDEKIKNKRCAINVRINPEMKDKFTAKVRSENRKINDVLRDYIEYYTLGYVDRNDNKDIRDVPNEYITTKIGVDTRAELDKACREMNLSMSSLVRSLISDWLKIKGYEVDKK